MNPIPNTCVDTPIDYLDPISNHMNYTSVGCRTEFSDGQILKMQETREFIRGELGEDVPTVIDERSAPVIYTNPTFDGEHIFVLPGADVTISGTVTLTNGAQFVAVGGTDVGGIDGIALSGGSLFDVRGYEGSLDLSGDVTVSGGSTLRLGVRVEAEADQLALLGGSPTFPGTPPLTVEGNVTVDSLGSTLDIGNGGTLSLGTSSVARFEDGGRYVTWGGTVLGAYAQLLFEQDAAIPELRAGFVEPTVALGRDAGLIFGNGDYILDGSSVGGLFYRFTIQRADPNETWDRIAFEGDNLTLRRTTIEGGTTGALVRARDIVFDDVILSGNKTGIEADYTVNSIGGSGSPTRSELSLTDTRVEGSTFAGLYLRNADVAIETSTAEHNADYGVYVSNATLRPLSENLVTASGYDETGTPIPGVIGDGVWVGADGDLYLGEPFSISGGASTFNRVADNRDDEIETASGAYLFIGDDPNGDNAVFKSGGIPSGTYLINNVDNSPVLAEKVYWGDPSGPPSGAFFKASLVDADPFLTADPTGGAGAPFRGLPVEGGTILASTTGTMAGRGGEGGAERLRERLHQLRQQVAANPAHPNARRLLRALYALQRLDRDDALGEHAQTMALLGQLRALLGEGAMPPPLRRVAEHALRAEVADTLRAEDYDGAEALLTEYGPLVTDDATRRGLLLSAASLDEQRGRYADAVAKLADVIASLPPEADELAASLGHEIAVIEGRAAEGDAGRPAGSASALTGTQSKTTTLPSDFALSAAYPNPLDGAAVIPFEVAEAADVSVAVYDVLGREVARLTKGRREAGRYRVRFAAGGLAAGVYVVRAVMTAEGSGVARTFSQKLTVLR